MRYVGKDFPLQDPTEAEDLAFDFSRHPGFERWDYITGATVAISVESGVDAQAASRLTGSPTFYDSCVIQRVTGPQDGVKYKLVATATMNSGEVLALYAYLTGKS